MLLVSLFLKRKTIIDIIVTASKRAYIFSPEAIWLSFLQFLLHNTIYLNLLCVFDIKRAFS